MTQDVEIWALIPDHAGYEASTHGRIRSPNKILSQRKTEKGYLTVDVRGKTFRVHRLVLMAFVGPCPEGYETRHLDNDPANNRRENLAWGTSAENQADKMACGSALAGSRKAGDKMRSVANAFNVRAVRQMRALGIRRKEVAKCFRVSEDTIKAITLGKRGYDRFT